MNTSIPKPAIAVVVALLLVGLVFAYTKLGGGAAPQVEPSAVPDYSKMTPEEISAAHNATPGTSRPDEGHSGSPSGGAAGRN
jgi:hypothetical protein